MGEFKKILILEHELEARLMELILEDRDIPHMIRSYHDLAYDGVFQAQKGWGHIAAGAEHEEEIKRIREDLKRVRWLDDAGLATVYLDLRGQDGLDESQADDKLRDMLTEIGFTGEDLAAKLETIKRLALDELS